MSDLRETHHSNHPEPEKPDMKWGNEGHCQIVRRKLTKTEMEGGVGSMGDDEACSILFQFQSLYFQTDNSASNSNIKNPSPSMEIESSKNLTQKTSKNKQKRYIHVYVNLILLLRQEKAGILSTPKSDLIKSTRGKKKREAQEDERNFPLQDPLYFPLQSFQESL